MVARQGDCAHQELTRQGTPTRAGVVGRAFGALCLAATHVLILAGLADYFGLRPDVALGFAIGTFVGLVSLVFEMAVIGRSMRLFEHNGMSATLQTFTMRLGVIGLLGTTFMCVVPGVDYQAFCMSYMATFFTYMCWLTWRTATAPVQYDAARARARRAAKTTRRSPVGSAR